MKKKLLSMLFIATLFSAVCITLYAYTMNVCSSNVYLTSNKDFYASKRVDYPFFRYVFTPTDVFLHENGNKCFVQANVLKGNSYEERFLSTFTPSPGVLAIDSSRVGSGNWLVKLTTKNPNTQKQYGDLKGQVIIDSFLD